MSQRSRLLVLLLAVSIPMVVLTSASLEVSVRTARERAERNAAASASAAAQTAASFIEGHIRSLRAIAVGVRDAPAMTAAELRQELLLWRETNPDWGGMSVVDENGVVIAGSRASSDGMDLSEREYLQRMFADGRVVVTEGLRTAGEEVPSVLIAAPVQFTDGTTGGVIGQLTLRTLSEVMAQAVRRGTRFSLVDASGQTIADTEISNTTSLLHIGERPDLRRALGGESGATEQAFEGHTAILVGFAPVPGLGWAVTVEEDSALAYAAANSLLYRGVLFISVTLLAVLVGGWIIGGRLNRSHEAVQAAAAAEAEARQRAEAALRSRDQFILLATHELRNPVTAIYGTGQLMQRFNERGAVSREQLAEYARSITESGAYLARLVEDLMDVPRLEQGTVTLRLEDVAVATLLARARMEIPAASLRLHFEDSAGDALRVHVDADRITQILVNLVDNAVKYSPSDADVHVTVTELGDEVQITVTDHGIGLSPEDLEQLFQPFARAASVRDTNIRGLGLGLYLSRQLAEAHGGRLDAHSDGAGEGSTFTLTLPLAVAPAVEPRTDQDDEEFGPVGPAEKAGV